MNGLIRYENAGFTIIEAHYYNGKEGYCIGISENQYVTWGFSWADQNKQPSFYHGHYFQIDHDAPMKSAARAAADYHRRLMEAYEYVMNYGV